MLVQFRENGDSQRSWKRKTKKVGLKGSHSWDGILEWSLYKGLSKWSVLKVEDMYRPKISFGTRNKTSLGHTWYINWYYYCCADFVQAFILLRFHVCIFLSVFRRHCLAVCILSLWLLKISSPLLLISLSLMYGGCIADVSFVGWARHCHLFFEFWAGIPVLSSICCKENLPFLLVNGDRKGSITFLQGCVDCLIPSGLSWTHVHMCIAKQIQEVAYTRVYI